MPVVDVIFTPLDNLLRVIGKNSTGFYRGLFGFLTLFGTYLVWNNLRTENPYSLIIPAALVLCGIGFSIYDYLRVDRRRIVTLTREDSQGIRKSQEPNLSNLTDQIIDELKGRDQERCGNFARSTRKIY